MRYGPGTSGGPPPAPSLAPKAKPPRPVHVAALRRADAITKQQRVKQQRIKQVQQLRQQRIDARRAARGASMVGAIAGKSGPKPIASRTFAPAPKPLPALGSEAISMQQRRAGLAALQQNKKRIAGPGHGFGHILHNLDTLGEYTVGLGMVKPSHAPGNILESVGVHTRLPHDQVPRPHPGLPLAEQTPSIGMVPFVPGSLARRLLGRASKEAVPTAETAVKETAISAEAKARITAITKELEQIKSDPAARAPFGTAGHTRGEFTREAAQRYGNLVQERAALGRQPEARPRTRTVARPRTPEEARARLAELDKRHEKIVGTIADRMKQEMGGKFDPAETGRRNLAKGALGGQRGKRAQSRAKLQAEGGKIPTQNEELRAAAEARLHQVLQRNPAQAKRFADLEHERQVLRDTLNEHAISGEAIGPGAGTVTEYRTPQVRATAGRKELGPLTGGQARAAARKEVAGSLMGERRAAAEQKKVYKAARSEKFAQAQTAGAEAGGGVAGYHAELGQLKGALPRVKFEKLKNGTLNQHDLEGLFNDVANHPDLTYGETLTGRRALMKAFEEGHALAPHEIDALSKVFGEDTAKILAHKSFARKVGENALGVLNLPRALMASVDISFPGRQGLGVLAASPKIWTKGFKPQLKGLVSEEYYQKMLDHMHQDPAFPLAQEADVKFTELGSGAAQREEPFATNILTNKPTKYNPIRASARAYTMYGDYVRLELFKKYLAKAEKQGVNIENKNELRDIGKVVNVLSGRGGGKTLQQSSPLLNTVFFAPQLIKSRLDMLNPLWYSKHVPVGPTTPFATRQAKIAGARLGVGLGATLGGAAALGAKVQTDPRNADFAKIRVGNTRVDIAGGLAQYPRAIAQIASGKVISSTTGKTMTLGPGFGQMSRKDVAERFGVGKLAPPMSAAYEALQGRTFLGQPLTVKNQVVPRVVPFAMQDAYDAYKQTRNPLAAAGAYGLSAIGEGVQTYGPQDPAKQTKKTYQKFNDEVNQALKKIHADFPPQLRGRLALRGERAAQEAKAGKTTADHFAADITLLVRHKAIDPKTANGMIRWVRGLPDDQLHHDQISSARSYLSRTYFDPGGELAAFVRALRKSGSPNLSLP